MTDAQVVPARAALVAVNELARNSDSAANTQFFAKENEEMGAVVALLPPGVSAPALGLNALIPGSAGWRDAGLGEKQSVRFRAPVWTFQLLFWAGRERFVKDTPEVPGPVDIPVWAVAETGQVVEVNVDQLVLELQPQFELAKHIFKNEESVLAPVRTVLKAPGRARGFLKAVKDQVVDVVDDIKAIGDTHQPPAGSTRPEDATHPPIEGVGYRTWVEVKAGLERDRVHPTHRDLYLGHRGVPTGRWECIDAAWLARVEGDPTLAGWADHDLYRMSMIGASWGGDP
jgi:hypothetical protein